MAAKVSMDQITQAALGYTKKQGLLSVKRFRKTQDVSSRMNSAIASGTSYWRVVWDHGDEKRSLQQYWREESRTQSM